MDEERLIQKYKEILNKMIDGCDNLIQLQEKCLYCMANTRSYEEKDILCTKKFGNDVL